MNENKICPLLSAGDPDSLSYCQGVRCAWYVPPQHPNQEGRCAVQYLGAMPEQVKKVGQL